MVFNRIPVVRIRTRDPWQHRAARAIARGLWSVRDELTLLAGAALTGRLLATRLDTKPLLLLTGLVAAVLLWPSILTGLLDQVTGRSAVRRRWARACRYAKLANLSDSVPRARAVIPSLAGARLVVTVPPGLSLPRVQAEAETLAAYLRLREVRVTRDPANAQQGVVTLVDTDPLDVAEPWPSPLANPARRSLWEPFPVGVDEDGQPVALSLPERNVLLGGEPGAGKSAALSLILSAAALDPTVPLTLLDGKQVEFAVWRPVADTLVGPDVASAVSVLEGLREQMNRRYTWLLDHGRRKVEPGDGLPLHLVAVDELAFYLHLGDRGQSKDFALLLWDLVARGRAAGIIVIAATQKPASDVVPSKLRDLFGFRWALRCATRDASDTILGAGWATHGYSAATIPGDQRGVGYLLAEGGLPTRMRAHYLDDPQLAAIAARAAALRADHLDAAVTPPDPARGRA